MSLVQHVRDGELAEWFTDRGAGLRRLAETITEQAQQRSATIRPPARSVGGEHFATVGGIVGQRLADLVEPAPPYAALLGAARCGALSLSAAGRMAAQWPTHAALTADQHNSGAHLHTEPAGDYWHIAPGATGPEVESEPALVNVIAYALAEVQQMTLGALDPLNVEARRVPIYYVLNLLESVYRGGTIPAELHVIARSGEIRVAPEIVDDVIEVLAAQSATTLPLLHDYAEAGSYGRLPAASYGHAAPVLIPGWAEGDVLLGPSPADGGYTLLDVKTVNRVDVERVLGWLRQTLAYALLDTSDRWRIQRFGLWLPRQAMITTFTIDEALACFSSDDPETEFMRLAWRAIRADGANAAALLAAAP